MTRGTEGGGEEKRRVNGDRNDEDAAAAELKTPHYS